MRLLELVEGDDGKLDEQSMLSIFFGIIVGFLMVYTVMAHLVTFNALEFASAAATFSGGSCGALTLRSRWGKGKNNADLGNQPPG